MIGVGGPAIISLPPLQISHRCVGPVAAALAKFRIAAVGALKTHVAIVRYRRGKKRCLEKILVVRHGWWDECPPVKFLTFGFQLLFVVLPVVPATPVFLRDQNGGQRGNAYESNQSPAQESPDRKSTRLN